MTSYKPLNIYIDHPDLTVSHFMEKSMGQQRVKKCNINKSRGCGRGSVLTDLSDCNESFKSVSLSFLCILLIFLACLTNLCNKELHIE